MTINQTDWRASDAPVLERTRRWVERAVIGLNLCPFAKAAQRKGQIHYVVSHARQPLEACVDLEVQLLALHGSDENLHDNTLLIYPECFSDFLDFNQFLDEADAALGRLGLVGTIQIASFHPNYQFAGVAPDDLGNFTNRSPHPVLHLLRESSIERAVAAFERPESIYEANIQTLNGLGHTGWRALDVGPPTLLAPRGPTPADGVRPGAREPGD